MRKKVLAAITASAMIAATALAAPSYADDSSTAEAVTEKQDILFDRGVWAALKADYSGNYTELSTFYVFYDSKSGRTENNLGGIPFTVKQKGTSAVFSIGGVDNAAKASFKRDGDSLFATIDLGGTETTYKLVKMQNYDPDSFDASALLARGVWSVFTADESGAYKNHISYYIFSDAESGGVRSADGRTGIPFRCEQNGLNVLFHFASADDETPATLKITDDGGFMITIGEGNSATTARLSLDASLDPDTFDIEVDETEFEEETSDIEDDTAEDIEPDVYEEDTSDDEEDDLDDDSDESDEFLEDDDFEEDDDLADDDLADDDLAEDEDIAEDDDLAEDEAFEEDTVEDVTEDIDAFIEIEDDTAAEDVTEDLNFFTATEDGGVKLSEAGALLMDASGTAGGTVGLKINFAMPLLDGFSFRFRFIFADGSAKDVVFASPEPVENDTVYIYVRELLNCLNAGTSEIKDMYIIPDKGSIVRCDIGMDYAGAVHIKVAAPETDDTVINADISGITDPADKNPATGVEPLTVPAVLAAAAALTAGALKRTKARK